MVLKPIRRSVVPSPLENQRHFDDFVTQYLNKCDDLLSYTKRYPLIKQTPLMTVQRQNRNPHETHRWLRRNVHVSTGRETSYDELKSILFVNRAEHLANWVPLMQTVDKVESIVPNLCDVYRFVYRSQGMKAKRDYCQLVVKREFLGEWARPKPRIFTPSASMANLAQSIRSQSSTNLAVQTGYSMDMNSMPVSPLSPKSPLSPMGASGLGNNSTHKGMKSARSVMDFNDRMHPAHSPPMPTQSHANNHYVGLSPQDSFRNPPQPHTQTKKNSEDSLSDDSAHRTPIRRFQVVTVPMLHNQCVEQKGYVRAYYETYEEVREYSDGSVEWTCIHHSDFSGWVPSFVADHSIASAFPGEAEALLEYVRRSRTRPLHNEY